MHCNRFVSGRLFGSTIRMFLSTINNIQVNKEGISKAFKELFISNNIRLLKPFLRVFMYFSSIRRTSPTITYFTANGPNKHRISQQNPLGSLLSTCLIRAKCSVYHNLDSTLIFIMYLPRNYNQYNGFFRLVCISPN
jgi:hypothetical protein